MRGSPPLTLATPLKCPPLYFLRLGFILIGGGGCFPIVALLTSRGARFKGLIATGLGAISLVMTNLATPMALCISSWVGRLLLLECVGLGIVCMLEGGWRGPLVRNGLGWLPFLVGHKLFIRRPCKLTDLSEVKALSSHMGISLSPTQKGGL